jgi:hypothetical protein
VDPPQHVKVLCSVIGIDRGDDAALSHRVQADECVTDGESLTGEPRLELGRHPGQRDVGTQPADIHPQAVDRAVRGDEQVQDVEALGGGVGNQPGIWTRPRADDLSRLRRVPPVTFHRRGSVRAGAGLQVEKVVPGPAGEEATPPRDVDDAVSSDTLRGEVS